MNERLEKSKRDMKFWDYVTSQKQEKVPKFKSSKSVKVFLGVGLVFVGITMISLSMLIIGVL